MSATLTRRPPWLVVVITIVVVALVVVGFGLLLGAVLDLEGGDSGDGPVPGDPALALLDLAGAALCFTGATGLTVLISRLPRTTATAGAPPASVPPAPAGVPAATTARSGQAGGGPHGSTTSAVSNDPLAVLAVVFGVSAYVCLPGAGAIAAIVCGHLARSRVARDPTLSGGGLALAGLLLGYVQVAAAVFLVTSFLLIWLVDPSGFDELSAALHPLV